VTYMEFPEMNIRWAFEAGLPDPATFPVDDLSRLTSAVLADDAANALQYGAAQWGSIVYGYEGLRDRLAERSQRIDGRDIDKRSVMLTLGGVQGITLACETFLRRGDVLAVEAPTWGVALRAAKQRDAEAVAIPMDRDGMQVDVLAKECERLAGEGKRLACCYTIATFNTPTGWSLSLPRRRQLVELAREHNFVILEDNVYGELRFAGEALPTIYSLDDGDAVVKIDSFSKTLAPGLRIGWLTGSPEQMSAMADVRGDLGVSQWLGRAVARYLAEDRYDDHVARVNALYREKCDVAVAALREHCGDAVRFDVPEGGFFLWCELAAGVDGKAVMKNALADGVYFRPGERFFGETDADVHKQWFRLAYSMPPIREIERGIAALGKAIAAARG